MNSSNSNINSDSKPIPTEAKKHYQVVWKVFFLIITVVTTFLLNKIYRYQTDPNIESIRKGSYFEFFVYGSAFGFVFILFQSLVHYLLDEKCQKHYLSNQRYQTQSARKKRAYTIVKWAYYIIYYAITSICAYIILYETTYMPTWLGGDGYCSDNTRYLNSFDQANSYMNIFYIVQFGKHLGRFFHHVFIRAQGNFYEFALHHGLSTFLIFFSYMTNLWLIGVFILLIHDITDCLLSIGRGYRDYKNYNKFCLGVIFTITAPLWIFCRIFALSYCGVYGMLSSAYYLHTHESDFPLVYDSTVFPFYFMGFMLFALEIMQIFWTYFIFKGYIEAGISKKLAKNTYE